MGREGERERNIIVWLPLAPTGDLTHNPGMCPDPLVCRLALSPLSHPGQGQILLFRRHINLKFEIQITCPF